MTAFLEVCNVSNKAYFVKLLKSFFDSSNWTTLENPDGTTIYTITPPGQDLTLSIKFKNEINFTISCGRLNKSFRILENNKKTSASIIFKAFECFCEEKQKVLNLPNFDATILKCFGLDEKLLDNLYNILIGTVSDRISMSKR